MKVTFDEMCSQYEKQNGITLTDYERKIFVLGAATGYQRAAADQAEKGKQ